MCSYFNTLLLPVVIIQYIVNIGLVTGNRNAVSKLPIIVFQINSINLIESEEFRETSNVFELTVPDLYFVFRRNESLAQSVWIGLYQTTNNHSSLKWIDDTPFVFGDTGYFQNWYPDEPNNPVTQKCVYIGPGHFLWGDVDCGVSHLAMCEAPCEYFRIITGRNEILAKVIFLQACVCPQGGCLVPGGWSPIFFWGGRGWWSPIFRGGVGGCGLQFFWGGSPTGIRSTFGQYASYWNAFLFAKSNFFVSSN